MLRWISGGMRFAVSNGPPGVACNRPNASVAITSMVGMAINSRRPRNFSIASSTLMFEKVHVARRNAIQDVELPTLDVRLHEMPRGGIHDRNAYPLVIEPPLGQLEEPQAARRN